MLAFACAAPAQQPAAKAPIPMERIFFKPYIAGTRPTNASLSPDGKVMLYQWDDSAANKYRRWMMTSDGANNHKLVDTTLGEIEFSPDGKTIACTRNGDIYLTDTSFTSYTRLTKTSDGENNILWSPDGKWLSFSIDKKIMALPVGKSGLTEIAAASDKDADIQLVSFSSDGKKILFTESGRADSTHEFLIPKYTGKEVTTRTIKNGAGTTRIGFAPLDTGAIVWAKIPGSNKYFSGSLELARDGKSALVERQSIDRKHRDIYVVDSDSGKATRILDENDKAWVENSGYGAAWMPDSKHVIYTWEKDGWSHLYSTTPDGKHTDQLTHGEWEILWFAPDPSGKNVYILANKDDHSSWQLFSVDVETKALTRLSRHDGSYADPVLAKDGSFIVAKYSELDKPSDYVRISTHTHVVAYAGTAPETDEVQLTHSVPAEFQTQHWTVPAIVNFKSRDGKMIPSFIYKPVNFDSTKKYPVVVFVHGAGYLQNVVRGWSYYYREFMFHTHLTQLGYVVFEVEYRGSAGLGHDFRTDVYMHLGGKDLDDEVDGIRYLESLGYVDPARVGIYGGSYGGFMTLMGLFCTKEYACGAALRAVTSWENYYDHNSWYTGARLGKPSEHADAYKISSPITYADSLKKPLLILHGMVDDNVFFQDAVQLVDKLQKSKKKFELMMYPGEAHSFTQPESWYDEYSRIEEFFNKNLHPEGRQ